MKVTPKQIFLSWDFGCSVAITFTLACMLNDSIPIEFAKDIYGVGISVLSITFSVYFAALALIMTSGDDDFVRFLEEKGDFTAIVDTFKFSLLVLFSALVYSILIYIHTSISLYAASNPKNIKQQSEILLWIFMFLFSYSLLSALGATLDSIQYSMFRAKFLRKKKQQQELNEQRSRMNKP